MAQGIAMAAQTRGWCDCSVERVILIAGVVASVAAVAAAIFLGEVFAAVGFALFGAMAVWRVVDQGGGIEEFDRLADQIQADGTKIEKQTKSLEEAAGKFALEELEYRKSIEQARAQIEELNKNNNRLDGLVREWGRERGKFQEQIRVLEEAKAGLEKELEHLTVNGEALKANMQKMLEQNLELAKNVGVFRKAGDDLSGQEAALRGAIEVLDGRFDEDFAQFSEQLAKSEEAANTLSQLIQQHHQHQSKEIEELRSAAERIAQIGERLKAQVSEVKRENQNLKETSDELKKRSVDLSEAEKRVAAHQKQLRKDRSDLEGVKRQLEVTVATVELDLQKKRQLKEQLIREIEEIRKALPNSQT